MDTIELYSRPGCPYSARLRWRLRRRRIPFRKIDIWQDEAARARVREVAGGDEVVPTVRIRDQWLVNPSIDDVYRALAGGAASCGLG